MAKKPITIGGKRVKWYSARLTVAGNKKFAHYGDLSMDAVRKRIYKTYPRHLIKDLRIKLLKRRPKGW